MTRARSRDDGHLDTRLEDVPRVPRRHWNQIALATVISFVVIALTYSLATNPRVGWSDIATYLFDPRILSGLLMTLLLTVAAMGLGSLFGVVLALMEQSSLVVISGISKAYVWFFRGTPLLVQLIMWYNLAALYPRLSIGFADGWELFSVDTNSVITPIMAAIVGLAMNQSAYMAEIVRAGLLGVDHGEVEAAQALGMKTWQINRRVVLPQALRIIIPPTGNQAISMLKDTSLVSVLALADLLYSAQLIYSQNYKTIPLLIVASTWYLLVTTVLTIGQSSLERRLFGSKRGIFSRLIGPILTRKSALMQRGV